MPNTVVAIVAALCLIYIVPLSDPTRLIPRYYNANTLCSWPPIGKATQLFPYSMIYVKGLSVFATEGEQSAACARSTL